MYPQEAFVHEVSVSRETLERLNIYEGLIQKWNPAINLVSKSTLHEIWSRHFLDSAQIFELLPRKAKSFLDIGTGGGFPGVVLAILAKENRSDWGYTMVESDQRKSTFLRTVARETGVNYQVISDRVETIEPQNSDVITARALASLSDLLKFSERHLKANGSAFFLKGNKVQGEIDEAKENWSFTYDEIPSKTSPDSVILKIGEIARA